jgi:NADH-quinone oxidoreductase subunit N
MLSLAGVPPLVGFYSKLMVLQAMVATYEALYLWLAVFAVVMSLVGAFYYLRIIKVMYFDEPAQGTGPLEAGRAGGTILSLNGALVLGLGLLPGGLMAICFQAISKSLAT